VLTTPTASVYAPIVSLEEDWADVRPPVQKTYFGRRDQDGTAYAGVRLEAPNMVTVNNDLPLRRDLFKHSRAPEWGYLGSGPSQLALAILADFFATMTTEPCVCDIRSRRP